MDFEVEVAKANGKLNDVSADTLGAIITKELVLRNNLKNMSNLMK